MEQEFVFSLPQFEGSLDLLLYLVKKHEMDVKDIKISIIADEFLNYINQMKRLNINIAADFMVMASTLMELKSKILLPNKSSEDIESIRKAKQELSERLVAYQQMKKLANKFKEKLDEALKLYSVRVKAEKTSDLSIKPENFSKLQELFEHVSRIIKAREKVYRIKSEKYSVAKKMEEILISFGNYGFPMVVSAYLLVRVEQKIDALSVSIKSLAGAIEPRSAL